MIDRASRLDCGFGGSAILSAGRSPVERSIGWQLGIACALAAAGAAGLMVVDRGPAESPEPVVAVAAPSAPAAMPSGKALDVLPALAALPPGPQPAGQAGEPPGQAYTPDAEPPRAEASRAEEATASASRPFLFTDSLADFTLGGLETRPPAARENPPVVTAFHRLPPPRPADPPSGATALPPPAVEAQAPAAGTAELGDLVRVGAETPTLCLPNALKDGLREAAARFGAITLVSTTSLRSDNHAHGSARAKMHAACQALDFTPPPGKLKEVVAYLKSRGDLGGIEGYRNNVVHVDARQQVQAVARRVVPRKKVTPILEEGDTTAE